MSTPDPLRPSAALLSKIGSIIVHLEEINSPSGHHFDKAALDALYDDEEVKEWLKQMDAMAMLPVKRNSK